MNLEKLNSNIKQFDVAISELQSAIQTSAEQGYIVNKWYEHLKKLKLKRDRAIALLNKPIEVKRQEKYMHPLLTKWYHSYPYAQVGNTVIVAGKNAKMSHRLYKKLQTQYTRYYHISHYHGGSVFVIGAITEEVHTIAANLAVLFSSFWGNEHLNVNVTYSSKVTPGVKPGSFYLNNYQICCTDFKLKLIIEPRIMYGLHGLDLNSTVKYAVKYNPSYYDKVCKNVYYDKKRQN